MRTTSRVLGLSLAGAALLLSACELPGGGEPPRTIVIPNPNLDPSSEVETPFSGFPATFRGTLFARPASGESQASGLFSLEDRFTTTVDGPIVLEITCDDFGPGAYVQVLADGVGVFDEWCYDTPAQTTVDGEVVVTIAAQTEEPGFHRYVVRADLATGGA